MICNTGTVKDGIYPSEKLILGRNIKYVAGIDLDRCAWKINTQSAGEIYVWTIKRTDAPAPIEQRSDGMVAQEPGGPSDERGGVVTRQLKHLSLSKSSVE